MNRVRKSDEGIEPTRTTDFALGLERAGGEGYAGAMGALVWGRCSLKGGAFGESGAFFSPHKSRRASLGSVISDLGGVAALA